MITTETLYRLNQLRLKEACLPNSPIGSTPISMFFEDGSFNSDNWFGGDDIIKQFIGEYGDDTDTREYMDLEFGETFYDVLCYWSSLSDLRYLTMVVSSFDPESSNIFHFRRYKGRGRLELAIYDGTAMNIEQYLFILNLIETTGFKFKLPEVLCD